ncbi:unnamed protein product [Owenia fusiformis]|uniref:Uncharacterized protein n=1 Tax=Owenia fusiformis TaxID=6347 RepID=A0A8J1XGL6_OWEFU|nr:unnamed protein product [Owenia fusiformis]
MIGKVFFVIAVLIASVGIYVRYIVLQEEFFDTDRLKGKRILITGGSSGIGEALAYTCAKYGAQVVITARRETLLQEVVSKCDKISGRKLHSYIVADMENVTRSSAVVDNAKDRLGGLDYVILNHAFIHDLFPWTGSDEDFDLLQRVYQINFLSHVKMAARSMTSLKQSHGRLIVISSLGGKLPSPFMTPYIMSKFALDGFFGSLNQQLMIEKSNISLTVCNLGLVDTKRAHDVFESFPGTKAGIADADYGDVYDVAYEILKAGTLGKKRLIYPNEWTLKMLLIVDLFFPDLIDASDRELFGN